MIESRIAKVALGHQNFKILLVCINFDLVNAEHKCIVIWNHIMSNTLVLISGQFWFVASNR